MVLIPTAVITTLCSAATAHGIQRGLVSIQRAPVGIQRALVCIQRAPVGIQRALVSIQWVLAGRVAPGGEENHAYGSPIRELELCPMVTSAMGNLSHQITSWLLTEDF